MSKIYIRYLYFILILISIWGVPSAYASHLVGGDLSYRCLGNNRFELTFKLYQDCLTGQQVAISADNPLKFGIYTGLNKDILVMHDSIYYSSTTFVPSEFSNECVSNPPRTCLQYQTFTTIVTLPPSSTGYRMIYQRCCRNNYLLNVSNSGQVGVTYFLDIPPFENNVCPNNSATFNTLPPQIICANNLFRYSFAASDIDGDSLAYRLCASYNGAVESLAIPRGDQIRDYRSVTYVPPFSANNPFPSNPQVTIDPITGMMEALPTAEGRFAVTVCVDEYRNGVLINTVSREAQFTITNCSRNVVASMPSWNNRPDVFKIQCESFTVNFENYSRGGDTYLWYFGVGNATSTEFEPTFTYPDTGMYEVKLVVNPGTTCSDSITKLVGVYPYFVSKFTFEGQLCPGQPIQFTEEVQSHMMQPDYYSWNFNNEGFSSESNPRFIFTNPGEKNVTLASANSLGCLDTASVTIFIDTVNAFAGNDTIIVKNYPFNLNASGLQNYYWTPGDHLSARDIPNPTASFPDTGKYTYVLTGTTPSGCEDSDTIEIYVVMQPNMFLPNAFSPNGDGLNDVLRPNIIGYSIIKTFEIYNRWGQLVYKSANNNQDGWDGTYEGKDADIGVYYYRVTYVDAMTNETLVSTGDVTLLR